jgi:hypothetical protein
MRSRSDRALRAILAAAVIATAAPARADEEPSVDFMHVLAAHGLHDFVNERVNAYGQITLIGHYKAPFAAKYTNLNNTMKSLTPDAEGSWTATATLYLAGRLWPGGEAYIVPELISEQPFSNLSGLGGAIQNGELQKGGVPAPTLYMSRVYLRQTVGLGGGPIERKSGQMQLGANVDARRLVFTLGKFSTIDFLDKNSFAGDVRRQFLGLGFMTHAAWDFATDARGYTWGAVAEFYFDDWAVRFAHTTVPINPNDLPIDFRFWKYFGDQVELEHDHVILGQKGAVRVLGYRNYQFMARFDDAIAAHKADPAKNAGDALADCPNYVRTSTYPQSYTSMDKYAPDLCWARKPNAKLGIGVNLEQTIATNLGLFFRAMYSDGQTEVYAYMPADRSLSFGALASGAWWRRPLDSFGAAFEVSWISGAHAAYLGQGGIDGFIGDGRISQAPESTFEVFYSVNLVAPMWLSADYQHVTNPAYNADRGPVNIVGARLHVDF